MTSDPQNLTGVQLGAALCGNWVTGGILASRQVRGRVAPDSEWPFRVMAYAFPQPEDQGRAERRPNRPCDWLSIGGLAIEVVRRRNWPVARLPMRRSTASRFDRALSGVCTASELRGRAALRRKRFGEAGPNFREGSEAWNLTTGR